MDKLTAQNKILVLDSNERSALAVIRSLGASPSLLISTADSINKSLGSCSKFSSSHYRHPSIIAEPKAFLEWLDELLTQTKFYAIFPCTEISSQLLLMNPEVTSHCKIPFASYETVMSLTNKGQLMKLANRVGVKTPSSAHFTSALDVNLEKISRYPIVIKPVLSQLWKKDHWQHTVVKIAHSKTELDTILKQTRWLQDSPFMLQEFVEGYGAGIFAIYNRGKPIAFFQHQRLREKPPQGGVSVLSKSAPLDPFLLKNAKTLLDKVKWHGVAMVEFRIATDGTPYLMEVNTRFWGSLQLAIDAGVDFPKLLYRITFGKKVSGDVQYNQKTKLRWLLGDFDSLYLVLKSSNYTLKEKINRIVQFLTPDFKNTRHQVARRGDWRPGIEELKQYFKSLSKR